MTDVDTFEGIAVFPEDANIQWDADLIAAGEKGVETLVRVGEKIGRVGTV